MMSSSNARPSSNSADWWRSIRFQPLPYNWVLGFPTVLSLFANVFFSVAAFGCSSFLARQENTVGDDEMLRYGYWGIRQNGKCHQFEFVDAPLRLGRALGLTGLVIGVAYLLFWASLWTVFYPKHILHVVAATMSTCMVLMSFTVRFMGPATESCDALGLDCKATGSGNLAIPSAVLWFLTGISVMFLSNRLEEGLPESAPAPTETARLVHPSHVSPVTRPPRRVVQAPSRPSPPMVHVRPASRPVPTASAAAAQYTAASHHTVPRPTAPTGPSSPRTAIAAAPPRLVQAVSVQPDGTKAITTTKSYVQPDGTAVIERTTEFSDHNDEDDVTTIDAFKPHPTAQPPLPEFDEERGRKNESIGLS